MGIFITVIMVGSTLGFFVGSSNNTLDNGLEFEGADGKTYSFDRGQGFYATEINGDVFKFYSHPLDVLRLNVTNESLDLVTGSKMIYLTFDPEAQDIQFIEQTRFDLANDLLKENKFVAYGVLYNTTIYNYDIITCENASQFVPVVEFRESNSTKGYVKNNCVIFEGKRYDFFRFRDLIIYKYYGLI